MVSSLILWIVSATSILAHRDADLEWGGDHPISKIHQEATGIFGATRVERGGNISVKMEKHREDQASDRA
jgi:hypothetical protein